MAKVTIYEAAGMAVGIGIVNFFMQAFEECPNWYFAGEITWYQSLALLVAWFLWRPCRPD